MRVLQLTSDWKWTGPAEPMVRLGLAQRERGFEVHLACPMPPDPRQGGVPEEAEKAGLLPDYECGIFERIEGWFDAMGLKYTRTPDLSRCLKYKGEQCLVRMKFDFQ